ncbi:unnamed protein product [Trifolium pratense]|uniref:Uncharacterized protein n=1 Tax=Trifolium pratense TaxID=57577 RepID=A0ACB0J6B2_TRIPR|nr:unnamed protein product [Trifolium pratense]
MSSTGRKNDGERRTGGSDRWRGMRSEEAEERRAKGLCFKWGGKWHPTLHKCPERSMRVLLLAEGETMNDDGEIVAMEVENSEEEEEIEAECKLIGVLGKMGEYNTMKLEGKLKDVDVEVLIDSGASHSFISPELTTALGLTIIPTVVKRIKLGDGHRVLDKILDEISRDVSVQKLLAEVMTDPSAKPGFSVQQGVLLYQGRLVIGPQSYIIPKLLKEFHETPIGGHSGFLRTYRRVAENLYWIGMQKTIREFVRACDICQRQKYEATTPCGLLQPLPIPNAVWEDISIDFITGLPKSKGFDAILVVVDRLSKYSHFILLKHPYTAKSVAEIFVKEVGTTLKMSSAYHPETDGQTEVINRCLESYLRCFAIEQPKTWSVWIPWAEYWYNTTYHVSIGKSPFEVVYGRQPPKLLKFLKNETKVAAVAVELHDRDEALNQLKLHLLKAQQQMQAYANQKRRDLKFEVGEWVFLKLRPHRQHSVIRRINQKLAARYYGPFKIIEKIGEVAYKLQLPDQSRIHPVFHVSLLKKAVGDYQTQGELPKELEVVIDEEVYRVKVLGTRSVLKEGTMVVQSLIQWKDKSLDDVTWEDNDIIRGQFPEFNLEDKLQGIKS